MEAASGCVSSCHGPHPPMTVEILVLQINILLCNQLDDRWMALQILALWCGGGWLSHLTPRDFLCFTKP